MFISNQGADMARILARGTNYDKISQTDIFTGEEQGQAFDNKAWTGGNNLIADPRCYARPVSGQLQSQSWLDRAGDPETSQTSSRTQARFGASGL